MVYATVGHCGPKIEVTWCISCTFATQCSYMLVSLQNLLEIDLSHIQTLLKNIYKYLRAPRKKLKNHPNSRFLPENDRNRPQLLNGTTCASFETIFHQRLLKLNFGLYKRKAENGICDRRVFWAKNRGQLIYYLYACNAEFIHAILSTNLFRNRSKPPVDVKIGV